MGAVLRGVHILEMRRGLFRPRFGSTVVSKALPVVSDLTTGTAEHWGGFSNVSAPFFNLVESAVNGRARATNVRGLEAFGRQHVEGSISRLSASPINWFVESTKRPNRRLKIMRAIDI